jgi:hypothetical protein
MRALILVAGAALAVSACSGGQNEANEVDTLAVNNLVVDENTAMDMNMGADMNMDMNATTTDNMMMNDMTTNDADTNLANGM